MECKVSDVVEITTLSGATYLGTVLRRDAFTVSLGLLNENTEATLLVERIDTEILIRKGDRSVYADQEPNSTAAYVNGTQARIVAGNELADEKAMISDFTDKNHFFDARVIFGSGRVAMIFKPRTL